ncbi:4519_t:CDS:2, partial [Entrophospora sp. SA101]
MTQLRKDEEWKERIWPRLQYFKDNNLLPRSSKKFLHLRKKKICLDGSSFTPEFVESKNTGLLNVLEININAIKKVERAREIAKKVRA